MEIAPTQVISTRASSKSQEGAASFSRGCTLIMLSVKVYLPSVWRKKAGRSRAPSRSDPPAPPSMNRISCLTNQSTLKRLTQPVTSFLTGVSRWITIR
jgi:hypothetical protein